MPIYVGKMIVSDPKSLIADLDQKILNQEFQIRIWILLLPRDGEKKVFNFSLFEDINVLKSSIL